MSHAVVWVDHKEARIVRLDDESPRYSIERVESSSGPRDKGRHHTHATPRFLEDLARRIAAFDEVLVTGPGTAREELTMFIEVQHPAWRRKIAAIEPSDHPTDGQLADHGRRVLRARDRMHGVHVR